MSRLTRPARRGQWRRHTTYTMLTDHCNWHLFEADGRRFVQFLLWFHDLPHTDEDVKLGYVVDWDKIENILWEDTDNVRPARERDSAQYLRRARSGSGTPVRLRKFARSSTTAKSSCPKASSWRSRSSFGARSSNEMMNASAKR